MSALSSSPRSRSTETTAVNVADVTNDAYHAISVEGLIDDARFGIVEKLEKPIETYIAGLAVTVPAKTHVLRLYRGAPSVGPGGREVYKLVPADGVPVLASEKVVPLPHRVYNSFPLIVDFTNGIRYNDPMMAKELGYMFIPVPIIVTSNDGKRKPRYEGVYKVFTPYSENIEGGFYHPTEESIEEFEKASYRMDNDTIVRYSKGMGLILAQLNEIGNFFYKINKKDTTITEKLPLEVPIGGVATKKFGRKHYGSLLTQYRAKLQEDFPKIHKYSSMTIRLNSEFTGSNKIVSVQASVATAVRQYVESFNNDLATRANTLFTKGSVAISLFGQETIDAIASLSRLGVYTSNLLLILIDLDARLFAAPAESLTRSGGMVVARERKRDYGFRATQRLSAVLSALASVSRAPAVNINQEVSWSSVKKYLGKSVFTDFINPGEDIKQTITTVLEGVAGAKKLINESDAEKQKRKDASAKGRAGTKERLKFTQLLRDSVIGGTNF